MPDSRVLVRVVAFAVAMTFACGGCDEPGRMDGGTESRDAGPAPLDARSPPEDAGFGSDAGPSDAGGGVPDGGSSTIEFTLPDPSVEYATGTVRLQLVTTGPDPDRVELWKNSSLLVVLPLPYTYDWLANEEAEGDYVFEARSLLDGAMLASTRRQFTIDRTGPSVVAVTPGPTEEASVADGITVEFSEPITPETVTEANVSVTIDGVDVAAERTLSPDGVRLTISPTDVVLPAEVAVSVSTSITDRAGNALVEALDHTVTYAAWRGVLSPAELPADRFISALAVSGSDVYLVHTDGSFLSPDTALARWDGSSLTALPALPSSPARATRLGVTSTGSLVAVWSVGGGPHDIHVADLAGGSWVERATLSGISATRQLFEVAIGAGDRLYIAHSVGADRIQVMTLDGGAWSAARAEIDPELTGTLFEFSFAIDETDAYIAIEDQDRCVLVSPVGMGAMGGSVTTTCDGAAVVDIPGPGVNALLHLRVQTGVSTFERRTRIVDPFGSTEDIPERFDAVAETGFGWIASQVTRIARSDRSYYPLDVLPIHFIGMLGSEPILASHHQLYLSNGPAIAP